MFSRLLAWLRSRRSARRVPPPLRWGDGGPVIGHLSDVWTDDDGIHASGVIADPGVLELLNAGMPEFSIATEPGEPVAEISDWSDHLVLELCRARLDPMCDLDVRPVSALLLSATEGPQIAYEVLVALARRVAVLLRPAGHVGGPIGYEAAGVNDPLYLRASQLVGFAAQGDVLMVDAIARATIDPNDPDLLETRSTLWAILEVLAREPISYDPQGDPK